MQSSNEELRSTLDELETSKEELQSMNEELQTVNQEHRHKVEELSELSSDLQNLLSATNIATLFLDRDLCIMRFTPPVGELFNIRSADRGRPISDLTHRLGYDGLLADGQRVLERLVPVQREVRDEQGRWYLTRVMPYRSLDDRIDGIVLTFVDITDRKRSEQHLREAKDYAEAIVETLHEPLVVLRPDLKVHSANRAFYDQFEVQRQETVGRVVYELGNGQWDIPELRRLLEDVLPENNTFEDYEVSHTFETIGERVMLLNARRLGQTRLILLGIRDITQRKHSEEALRRSELRLQKMISIPAVGVLTLDRSGTVLEANQYFVETFGHSHEEIEAGILTWRDWTPPEYVEETERQFETLDETGTIGPYEKEYLRSDGSRTWTMFAGADLGDGTIVEYCIDISDRKKAERQLQRLTATLEERVDERTRQVRELSETLARAEQHERQRLSHVLHGDVQQLLYGIQMKITMARNAARRGSFDGILDHMEDSLGLLDDAITRTRQLTVDLNPPILHDEGLMDAIEWLRTNMKDLHGLDVEVTSSGSLEIDDVEVRMLLFRVIRELLFNVAKHADTDRATVTLTEQEDGRMRIVVADGGRGFDATTLQPHTGDHHGLGLVSARERLRMHGGDLMIDSIPGDGARVSVYGPLPST